LITNLAFETGIIELFAILITTGIFEFFEYDVPNIFTDILILLLAYSNKKNITIGAAKRNTKR